MRLRKYLFIGIFFLALIGAFYLISDNASADTHVWVGTTSADASVATNWRVMPAWGNGVPGAGDDILFNTTSAAKACTWNLANNSFASYVMTTGYSGTITQASNLYVTSFNMAVACTFTASQSYAVYDSGNFVKTAGTMTADKIILVLTGTNKYFAVNADIRPAKITVSGTYQFNSTVTFQATTGTRGLDISGTVTLLQVYLRPYNTVINYVSITGTVKALDFTNLYSTAGIHFYVTSAATYTPISLSSYIQNNLYLLGTRAATVVLPTNVHCYNLVVRGAASYLFTLDLHGYDITADYSIGFDAVGYGRIRNLLASDNSWIHTQSFQNATGQTGQSYLYTSHLYLNVGYWQPSMLNSPAVIATNGVPYSFTPSWNETLGENPTFSGPGWASFAGGSVSGTPNVLGAQNFYLNATSQNGTLVLRVKWSVTVSTFVPMTWTAQITNSPASNCTNSTSYYYDPSWNESVTSIVLSVHPAWASLSNGHVVGTPTTLGPYTFQLDYASLNGTLTSHLYWTVTVDEPAIWIVYKWAPVFTNFPNPEGNPGDFYSYSPTCNETVNYTLIISPQWLTLDNGTLSGVCPAHGEYQCGLQATSANGTLSAWVFWIVHCSIIDDPSSGDGLISIMTSILPVIVIITIVSMLAAGIRRRG